MLVCYDMGVIEDEPIDEPANYNSITKDVKRQRHNLGKVQQNMEQVTVERTVELVKKDLDKAYKAGDFAAMATLSREMSKLLGGAEKAQKEAKTLALVEKAKTVKAILDSALKSFIDKGELDTADGVWYVYDFGDKMSQIRLTKTAVRKSGEGRTTTSQGAKVYDRSTEEMLKDYGDMSFKVDGKDTEETLNQHYASSTDKNSRFGVRKQLIKLDNEAKQVA